MKIKKLWEDIKILMKEESLTKRMIRYRLETKEFRDGYVVKLTKGGHIKWFNRDDWNDWKNGGAYG